MFHQLRNRFVLINLITTSAILIVAFSTIYLVTKNYYAAHKPLPPEINLETTEYSFPDFTATETTYVRNIVREQIEADRKTSLNSLLLVLIFTGLAVEFVVTLFSFYFAEQAIKPVKETYEAHKIFIANASHEIKTPIAAIKANLEAADLSETNRWIKNIELEADKIDEMNHALLTLAKSDAIKEAIVTEPITLKDFSDSLLASFSSRIQQKGIKLRVKLDLENPNKVYILNVKDLKEISAILLDNAIKYGDKKISLTIKKNSLSVKNDGATIPPENLPRIFDRFYQVDKSASGSGLGLAIAKSLADRNHWSLAAASDKKSTTFTLNFS